MSRKRVIPAQPPVLTVQEQRLLLSIWDGHSIAQTADLVGVDLRAAESVRNALKYKFGARNSAQLIRMALGYRLIQI